MVFRVIIVSLFLFDVLWWVWADARLRKMAARPTWRRLLAAYVLAQMGGYLLLGVLRFVPVSAPMSIPRAALVAVYLWHLILAPVSLLIMILGSWAGDVGRLARRAFSRPGPIATPQAPTRRQFLSSAAVALPPLATFAATGFATEQLDHFRINRVKIPIAGLPPELEGLNIAHVTDTHIGRFTTPDKLRRIVEQTNALGPDLVVMTGDLIDFSIDDLPQGIEMMHGFRPRLGTFLCEGNHDLFQDRHHFESAVRKSGLRLLLNESAIVRRNAQAIQLLGIKWGGGKDRRDAAYETHVPQVAALRKPDAFPILLAHHPHAFDAATAGGLPLTLSGHTHGGQITLAPGIGFGPLMYKYWSGIYRKNDSTVFVSNGVGNWFPLRINTPAEIIHITLHRAQADSLA